MANKIKITASFTDVETGKPLTCKNYTVRIYDKDVFKDDFLGESKLDKNGKIELITSLDKARSFETPFESKPDIYFVVLFKDEIIFKSRVFKNVEFLKKDKLTGSNNDLAKCFGEFKIFSAEHSIL